MYDIISDIIGHEWVTNYSGDQAYIYYICSCIIIILTCVFIDLVYRLFRGIWHR